jgi:hypothetical protein
MVARAILVVNLPIHKKTSLVITYIIIMILQLTYNTLIINGDDIDNNTKYLAKIFGTVSFIIPYFIENRFEYKNMIHIYLPSIQNIEIFSFIEIRENKDRIIQLINKINKKLSKDNILEIINDLPRHSAFRYINNGSLTPEYFEKAKSTFDDPHLYIVISNSGSPANEIISIFTKKQYNHAAISFDKNLETIVSYNGGEKIYPPGMNQEMIEYYNKKEDASIIIYSLNITKDQKMKLLGRIEQINEEGNAYNLLGLIFKHRFRSNIMYCSQFVYVMLKDVGVQFITKSNDNVSPMELIELDYHRKLRYEYEIKFNKNGEHCA